MNRFIKILAVLLLAFSVQSFADEQIVDFSENSIPVLNEELRKLKNSSLSTSDIEEIVDDLTGTTANKLVKLDSNAKLPAVDGSALTGVVPSVMPTGTYGCKAWVNFQGTGTVAIRASGNVSSITDGGTGIYRVNFTTAMPDTNFAALASTHMVTAYNSYVSVQDITNSGYVDLECAESNAPADASSVFVAIYR